MDYQTGSHKTSMKISGKDKIDEPDYYTAEMREFDRHKPFMAVFDRCKRPYAPKEECIFENKLQELKQKGYRGQKYIRIRAYELTQIDILENTMRDATKELAGLGVPDAYKIFRREFAELEIAKENVMGDYPRNEFRRKDLWHEIGDVWHHAWHEVIKLSKIEQNVQEAKDAESSAA